jgi:outer membrane biosynthesis protein TonB
VSTKPTPAPKPTPKPLPKPAPKPAPQSPTQPLPKAKVAATPPLPQGQTVAGLSDGQQVAKLGPMTFDKSALAACEGSCSLKFTGAGGSVKVAFFKQVWAPALEAKSGGVYLTGLVKKNGSDVKIILSNVQ